MKRNPETEMCECGCGREANQKLLTLAPANQDVQGAPYRVACFAELGGTALFARIRARRNTCLDCRARIAGLEHCQLADGTKPLCPGCYVRRVDRLTATNAPAHKCQMPGCDLCHQRRVAERAAAEVGGISVPKQEAASKCGNVCRIGSFGGQVCALPVGHGGYHSELVGDNPLMWINPTVPKQETADTSDIQIDENGNVVQMDGREALKAALVDRIRSLPIAPPLPLVLVAGNGERAMRVLLSARDARSRRGDANSCRRRRAQPSRRAPHAEAGREGADAGDEGHARTIEGSPVGV